MGSNWRETRAACAGKEIFEVKPVLLGGSPTDPANKALLDREQHIKTVCYWNHIIHELRRKERSSEGK